MSHTDCAEKTEQQSCSCCHGETKISKFEKPRIDKKAVVRFAFGGALFIAGLCLKTNPIAEFSVLSAAYLIIGGDILLKTARNIAGIFKGNTQWADENFLMTIASIGAFAIGETAEGAAVMLFYQIGEFFQEYAVNRSKHSISALLDIRPDSANIEINGEIKKVPPETVLVGDTVVIKPGERVPLDGVVISGTSSLDTSAITGEALPKQVEIGDEILSGFINQSGVISVMVTKPFSESTVAKILDLVENAGNKKSRAESFITKFAKYYTPAVVALAALIAVLPPLFISGAAFSEWINRGLIFLVISCPCALVVSIPLSFFGGIGRASKSGILIKGGNYLESLNKAGTVVFDKTGTLTKGEFSVAEIKGENTLKYAAYAESMSSHPIALSIVKHFKEQGGKIDGSAVSEYVETAGQGISVSVDGKKVAVGNEKLLAGIKTEKPASAGTAVHVAVGGIYEGYIVISDQIKPDAKKAIDGLKKLNIGKIIMLTGDNKESGEAVASELGIDKVYTGLLPQDKVEKLEEIIASETAGKKVIFVGDGINDAPVLARADIGIAMGALGSDAAIEAADAVIMTDEPSKLADAVKIARKTREIVWQNIILALAIKLLVLILGAGGMATMWEAVFADVGVALLAVANAGRLIMRRFE